MVRAKPTKEILVKVRNDIGILHELTRVTADRGVNLVAVCGWVEGENGLIRLVADDHERALDALRAKNFHAEERDAVSVDMPHHPGLLKTLTEYLSREGIDLHHLYASADLGADSCLVIFASSNNDHAIVALNRMAS